VINTSGLEQIAQLDKEFADLMKIIKASNHTTPNWMTLQRQKAALLARRKRLIFTRGLAEERDMLVEQGGFTPDQAVSIICSRMRSGHFEHDEVAALAGFAHVE